MIQIRYVPSDNGVPPMTVWLYPETFVESIMYCVSQHWPVTVIDVVGDLEDTYKC